MSNDTGLLSGKRRPLTVIPPFDVATTSPAMATTVFKSGSVSPTHCPPEKVGATAAKLRYFEGRAYRDQHSTLKTRLWDGCQSIDAYGHARGDIEPHAADNDYTVHYDHDGEDRYDPQASLDWYSRKGGSRDSKRCKEAAHRSEGEQRHRLIHGCALEWRDAGRLRDRDKNRRACWRDR